MINSKPFELLTQKYTEQFQQMQKFWVTKNCRWQYLLAGFGFKSEANNFRCGHCDRCQK